MSGIVTKAVAEIVPGDDDAGSDSGTFRVLLSAQTTDRDGDTLLQNEWKTPLPDHITFDIDHQMSVAGTVGSGVPSFDGDGNLVVDGTYSSIPRAQEVRTLVNEGHIRTTSVAFLTDKSTKGAGGAKRELLNGAFVAVPSNREAVVLSSKALDVVEEKAGRRNSAADLEQLQAAHDAVVALGADCGTKHVSGAEAKAAPDEDDDTDEPDGDPDAGSDPAAEVAGSDPADDADEVALRSAALRARKALALLD